MCSLHFVFMIITAHFGKFPETFPPIQYDVVILVNFNSLYLLV